MLDQIVQRLTRIARRDWTVFQEIRMDAAAFQEAAIVVIAAAVLSALGTLIGGGGFLGFVIQIISIVVLYWLLWSWVTAFIAQKMHGADVDFQQMARILGYALAPTALGLLSFIPCLGALAGLLGSLLSAILVFFAVRESLGLPTDKTLITIIIGWVVVVVLSVILAAVTVGAAIFGAIGASTLG